LVIFARQNRFSQAIIFPANTPSRVALVIFDLA
jgi:hypothetical protein